MIYDVTDLEVYNRALKALRLVYKLANQVPNSNYKLSNQLTSAAEGIPAHIAEGWAKRSSAKEWKRFLSIGMGSSDETITQARAIKILSDFVPRISKDLCDEVTSEYKIISKQINRLRTNWIDYGGK